MSINHKNIAIRARQYIAFLILVLCTIYPVRSESVTIADKEKINLLIVHSFEENLPDYSSFNKLVIENLERKRMPVETQVFYLDCDAYGRDDEIKRVNDYLDTMKVVPDFILVTDDQATYSLLASRHPFLKTVPIVFSGVNFPNTSLLKEYSNVTGILDKPDYEKNIRMIEKLMGIKRIRFFYDKTYNGKKVIERLAEQYKEKDDSLYHSLNEFLQNNDSIRNDGEVKASNEFLRRNDYHERPLKTSLYFINMWEDLGRNLMWNISGSFRYSVFLLAKYDFSTANVGRLATVPTFSAVNKGFTFRQDILGGYFTTLEDQVEKTCEYIYKIAKGEDISLLPIIEVPKRYVLDWGVMERWGISLKDVPEGIEIINIPFLVKYKTEVIVCSSIFAVFIVLLIAYLLFLYYREVRRKRRAQINLWEEKEFLSLALEGGSIFAWRYDNEKNEFIFDKEFLDSVGINLDALKLNDLRLMTHPEERECAVEAFINVSSKVGIRGDIRARLDFNGQGYVWYEFRFLNISGVLGDKSSVIGLVMNIQDYKNKEQELIIARDLASKAELKQSFLANMSHEIRTPLNAIVGFSNMLVDDDDLPDEDKRDYIHIINMNCELLLKLINDILEISRIESGNVSFSIENCNLNSLVEDVYNMCMLQTPLNVEFIKNMLREPFYIETDVMRLKQVLVNFVNNAFKFTSSGHVAIGLDLDEERKEVCIYVEDTGEGISETHQKMIFDRFYKVNEFAQGTGLGLSICQVIVSKLNGRITLTSKENEGSRFGIVLPYGGKPDMEQYDEELPEVVAEADMPFDETRPVILIAEDSVSNYLILNNILKKYCNIVWAINGKDVLEIIRKRKIDLVLMDIKMHGMDGITALIKLRKSFKKLPVIVQTAYAFEENKKLAEDAGASDFIAKPISSDILLKSVSNFIQIAKR